MHNTLALDEVRSAWQRTTVARREKNACCDTDEIANYALEFMTLSLSLSIILFIDSSRLFIKSPDHKRIHYSLTRLPNVLQWYSPRNQFKIQIR